MSNKLALQIAVCIGISAIAVWGKNLGNPEFLRVYNLCTEAVMHTTTVEEVQTVWNHMATVLNGAPAKIVSAVTEVNEASKYGQPIDKEGSGDIRQVHAVAGGVVEKTGYNEEYGLYVKLKHENAVSVYGNLDTAGVVEKERIQRGEIIGSFDSSGEKEFYYELHTDL
ncbi:MAG: M23 family metallopeptidase [Firmicutes bacterium]|nr:M23 family metallopeptidase [Bacillota bacterium]